MNILKRLKLRLTSQLIAITSSKKVFYKKLPFMRRFLGHLSAHEIYLLCKNNQIAGPVKKRFLIVSCSKQAVITGDGKLKPKRFLPPFIDALAMHDIQTDLAAHLDTARSLVSIQSYEAVIFILGEDKRISEEHKAALLQFEKDLGDIIIFNRPSVGLLLADKRASLQVFEEHGVATPRADASTTVMFSYPEAGSGKDVELIGQEDKVRDSHLVTKFIDTTVEYNGEPYYTSVRLACVNNNIMAVRLRACPVSEGVLSIHGYNTPKDARLLIHLNKILHEPFLYAYQDIADKLHKALGDGCYAHDLLIEKESSQIYICESGYKFFDDTHVNHFASILDELPHAPEEFDVVKYAEKVAHLSADRVL